MSRNTERHRMAVLGAALAFGVAGCSATAGGRQHPPAPSATVAASQVAATLDPDAVFAGTTNVVWRNHAGPGDGPFATEDVTVQAGSYRLQVACRGGTLSIAVNDAPARSVDCSTPASIPVCLRKQGIRASAHWTRTPHDDVVWQLARQPGSCQ